MKLCTVTTVTGLDQREHYAVVALGAPNWPLALCGPTSDAKALSEAKVFADAPVMLDMLERLVQEVGNINPAFPLGAGKAAEIATLAERVKSLVNKHRPTQAAKK